MAGYDDARVGSSANPLPHLSNAPLTEVALAVQFQPMAADTLAAADFYRALRDEFPGRQEQPSRPPMREDFTSSPQPPFRIEVVSAPPMPRFWFLSESGTQLVQLQGDLLAFNWRRAPEGIPTDEDYPRYARLRESIARYLDHFQASVEQPLRPNWCEVTYINQIAAADGSSERPQLDQLLRGVQIPAADEFLPSPENVALNLSFVVPGTESPRGRLTVVLATGRSVPANEPIWVMTLTGRIHAEEETLEAALNALDVGHEWVGHGFFDLTSDEIQRQWGKEVE